MIGQFLACWVALKVIYDSHQIILVLFSFGNRAQQLIEGIAGL
jgi:hypothetical protein